MSNPLRAVIKKLIEKGPPACNKAAGDGSEARVRGRRMQRVSAPSDRIVGCVYFSEYSYAGL